MSSLFKIKTPPPDPKIKEMQDKQEAMLEQQEVEKRKQIAARQRARRTGGQRMLLSEDRGAEVMAGLQPLKTDY